MYSRNVVIRARILVQVTIYLNLFENTAPDNYDTTDLVLEGFNLVTQGYQM